MEDMNLNVAYKAVPIGTAVVFLFDSIDIETVTSPPLIKVYNKRVYVTLGKNAIPITREILVELNAAPNAMVMVCGKDVYAPTSFVGVRLFEPNFLIKTEGVLEIATPSENEHSAG